jgi:hypothetical protein
MKQHLLWSTIELASPPEWLAAEALQTFSSRDQGVYQGVHETNNWKKSSTHRQLTMKDGSVEKCAFIHTSILSHHSSNWARLALSLDNHVEIDVRSAVTVPGNNNGGPHRDYSRNYILIYVFNAGSDDQRTVFYRDSRGAPISVPLAESVDRYSKGTVEGTHFFNDFGPLDIIEEAKFPVGQWVIMNGTVLHSITNVMQGRKTLQISLDYLPDSLKLLNPIYYTE